MKLDWRTVVGFALAVAVAVEMNHVFTDYKSGKITGLAVVMIPIIGLFLLAGAFYLISKGRKNSQRKF